MKPKRGTLTEKEIRDALKEAEAVQPEKDNIPSGFEDNKIYGDDYEELMKQHLDIYTGCSVIMLIAVGLFLSFVIGISLFMGAN